MIDQKSLERAADRFQPPERSFERLVVRRARKDRNRRTATVVFAAIVALASLAGLVRAFQTTPPPATSPTPSAPTPSASPGPAIEVIRQMPALLDENMRMTPAFAQAGGWIALRNGGQIVAVDPADPSRSVVLGPAHGADPIAWSFDGSRLLLSSKPEGWPLRWSPPAPRLFVMSPDGSRVNITPQIPGAPWTGIWGSFSPDGASVVYGCCGDSRGPYVIDLYGGSLRALSDPCPNRGTNADPVEMCGEPAQEAAEWAPDGSRIAWFDFAEGSIEGAGHVNVLSFVNPDGTGLREGVARLSGTFGNSNLVWSPDGSKLAYWHGRTDTGPGQIFVINADGSRLRQITNDGDNRWPTWSPDGSRIAFVRNGSLYTIAPDGSDLQEIEGVSPDGPIAWNPVA